jgi:hypothetical protein
VMLPRSRYGVLVVTVELAPVDHAQDSLVSVGCGAEFGWVRRRSVAGP